ncbi:FkbM family methyltransferase [Nanoarchaeota archaeon]
MFLDQYDTAGYSVKPYEPHAIETMKKTIKKGDWVIDLGACIGYYTLVFAKLVGPKGKVFAFEPDKDNFKLLKKNVQLNDFNNVVCINKAVIDKVGTENLYLSDNIGGHVMYKETFEKSKSVKVQTTTVDEYFKDVNRNFNLIKMDIDGSEARAIHGASRLLDRNAKIKMLVEFAPERLKDSGIDNPNEFLDMLQDKGFKISAVNEQKKRVEPADITSLIRKCKELEGDTKGQGVYVNLLCVKDGKD